MQQSIIAPIIPAIRENICNLSLFMMRSIFEYMVEVGVIINTEYCGFPFSIIGLPVVNLSPLTKSYIPDDGFPNDTVVLTMLFNIGLCSV